MKVKFIILVNITILLFATTVKAEDISDNNYVSEDTYGTNGGQQSKYFKFIENENDHKVLQEVDPTNTEENTEFKVIYSPSNYTAYTTSDSVDYQSPDLATNKLYINNAEEITSGTGYGGMSTRAIVTNNSLDYSTTDIVADFVHNWTFAGRSNSIGGAITNMANTNNALIRNISGTFVDNYAYNYRGLNAYGGAIYNGSDNDYEAIINSISGTFIYNKSEAQPRNEYNHNSYGGSIANFGLKSTINTITGDFIGNFTKSNNISRAGSIYNAGNIGDISGYFLNNYANGNNGTYGGAIFNNTDAKIDSISGNFVGNYAWSVLTGAYGGAIYNDGGEIGEIINSNFIDNYVAGDDTSKGGAIYSNRDISIKADAQNSLFEGNNVNGSNNAIYIEGTEETPSNLNLYAVNQGNITFNDKIDGTLYNINISGDGSGSVLFNNGVSNVSNLNLKANSITHLGINSSINALNMISDSASQTLSDNISSTPIIKVDVEVVKEENVIKSGMINVENDISGNYSVIVNSLNEDVLDNNDVFAPFLSAPNDDIDTYSDFEIARVIGSPYLYGGSINSKGETSGSTWYLNLTNDSNPNYGNDDDSNTGEDNENGNTGEDNENGNTGEDNENGNTGEDNENGNTGEDNENGNTGEDNENGNTGEDNENGNTGEDNENGNTGEDNNNSGGENDGESIINPGNGTNIQNKNYAPEVVAGVGLVQASIQQTSNMVNNIKHKVMPANQNCLKDGNLDSDCKLNPQKNAWILTQSQFANIDSPVDMEAKIYSVEMGFDIQKDMHNTFGVFLSYRNGEYDLNGKGSKIHSSIGSEIDIDSYTAGLYYHYAKNSNWLFATLFGGTQSADINTDDAIAKFNTDALQLGASVEIGHIILLSKGLLLEPSLGLYYTQINFDNATDNVGKYYKYDNIKHLELELGTKIEKRFAKSGIYLKPSIIQTYTTGDKVAIKGLSKTDGYKDRTLGRIEVGGDYELNNSFETYTRANYTFGSSYDATSLEFGLNYNW